VVEFSVDWPSKTKNKARFTEEKMEWEMIGSGISCTRMMRSEMTCAEMICTGTFVEDLIASVERAETQFAETKSSAMDEAFTAETMIVEAPVVYPETVEPWLVSAVETPEFDSKLLGVA
jgi:hypothetical protein